MKHLTLFYLLLIVGGIAGLLGSYLRDRRNNSLLNQSKK
jgi:hypothetical protein